MARARSRRAPRPLYTAKREPAIFIAASKSRIPAPSPSSQWALGLKSNCGGAPQRRTSTLSAADLPTGTLECGILGTVSRKFFSCSSSSATFPSIDFISSERCFISSVFSRACAMACSAAGPSPIARAALINIPTSLLSLLRSALRTSTTLISSRRLLSISRNGARSSGTPRSRAIFSITSRCSRTYPKSSIGPAEYMNRGGSEKRGGVTV